MQLKKLTSLLIAGLILFSNLGLAFSVHFCNDEIASVSLSFKSDEPCEESKVSCCSAKGNHKKCCSETTIKVDKKTDNVIVKSFHFDLPAYVASGDEFSFDLNKNIVSTTTNKLIENYCESNAPPFYKLYCQLVFYA